MLADLGLFYCAFFWGLSFATMKILVDVYTASWLLFLRFSCAALMIFVFFHKRIFKYWRELLISGIIIGSLLYFALFVQTIGLRFISAGRSAFISAIYVLIVPLMIWAYKKIFPGWITLIAAFLCVIGMYFLTDEGSSENFTIGIGDLLTFLCAVTFALQVLSITKYTSGRDPIVLSFISFTTVAILSFIVAIFLEKPQSYFDINSIYELLFTIIFCTFGCYMVQICAQKYAKPSHAVIIMSLESVFGLLSGIIFLHESLTLRAGIGCTLIFIAVLMSELQKN